MTSGGSASKVGGFVGSNEGDINAVSSSTSVAAGTGAADVGGFAGRNDTPITLSQATGDVSSGVNASAVAGFVGLNSGAVHRSLSAGNIQTGAGSEYVGGLIGRNAASADDISVSYYNIDAVSINGRHAVTLNGIYDNQYADWVSGNYDLLNINRYFGRGYYGQLIVSSVNDVKNMLPFIGYSKSSSASIANFYWVITGDIDLASVPGFNIPDLGTDNVIDGGGHVLRNLSLTNLTDRAENFGFVGVNRGQISNLGIDNATITVGNGADHVGALVGYNLGGIFNSGSTLDYKTLGTSSQFFSFVSRNTLSIGAGATDVGGIVGLNAGTLDVAPSASADTVNLSRAR